MADEIQTDKYDKTGYISYGNRIKMEHFVYDQVPDIGPLLVQSRNAIEALRKDSIDKENKIFDEIGASIKKWLTQASFTRSCNRALEYLSTQDVSHTGNIWVKQDYNQGEKISNKVFSMSCRIWETTKYDYRKGERLPLCYATWDLFLNTPKKGYGLRIAGQQDKRFTNRTDAEKYLDGRKKAYAAYFLEICPPIPAKYKDSFIVHGHLLPGYIVEGMEPRHPELQKPSVLEKLNEGKLHEKTSGASVPGKKKETAKTQEPQF